MGQDARKRRHSARNRQNTGRQAFCSFGGVLVFIGKWFEVFLKVIDQICGVGTQWSSDKNAE